MNPFQNIILWIKAKWHFRGLGVSISFGDHNPGPKRKLIEQFERMLINVSNGGVTMEYREKTIEEWHFMKRVLENWDEFAGDDEPDLCKAELEFIMTLADKLFV